MPDVPEPTPSAAGRDPLRAGARWVALGLLALSAAASALYLSQLTSRLHGGEAFLLLAAAGCGGLFALLAPLVLWQRHALRA